MSARKRPGPGTPRVSVCIPTYHYARYLGRAIESVLEQSWGDFELVVIDDASTDDSAEVVAKYARRDARVQFHVNPTNLGMVPNWNRCLKESSGEYVKYLLADDFLASRDALATMVAALDAHPGVSLVTSARQIVTADGAAREVRCHQSGSGVVAGREMARRCVWAGRNLVGEPTAVMFRRCLAEGGFDEGYRQLVDLEMWLRLMSRGDLYHVAEPLCAFRVHGGQQTAHNKASGVGALELLLYGEYLRRPELGFSPLQRAWKETELRYLAYRSWRKGRIDAGEWWRFCAEGGARWPSAALAVPFIAARTARRLAGSVGKIGRGPGAR